MKNIQINQVDWSVLDAGAGDPILFVHGFPLDHSMWREQIDELSGDFRVIVPDLPGFGQSGAIDGTLSMARLADDLAILLDRLEIAGPVIFCGLSMGGYVGWQFWSRHRDRISRLIQCDTKAVADPPEVARGREMMAANMVQEGAAGVAAVSESLIPKLFAKESIERGVPAVQATIEVILSTSPKSIAAAQLGMAEREEFSGRLGEITLPCLLVCGEHDVISPPSEMRQIAEAIKGSQYVEISGAGHMAPLEDPVAFHEAFRTFLASGVN